MEERLPSVLAQQEAARSGPRDEPAYDVIELLFFAYRDFVGDADRLLADYGFGRAHHRVLHFVNRRPGLTIAELLDLLRITKQSLNRVLKDLVDQAFIEQRAGTVDRRQRHLYSTERGAALALEISHLQSMRIGRALRSCPPGTRDVATVFLEAMIDPVDRPRSARRGSQR